MACASSSSIASINTRSGSWSPPSAVDLSVIRQIDDQLDRLKGQSSIVLDHYDLVGINVDIENAIMNPSYVTLTSQFGYALLAHGKDQNSHCTDDVERVLGELNIDTHTVINSSRKEFIEALLRLVSLTIRQQTHTLVLVAYSGGGNEIELHFTDGNLRIEHILDFLLLVPTRAPLVLIFDCICVKVQDELVESIKVPLSHTLKLERHNRGYIFHLATRSELSDPSIFDRLPQSLSLGGELGTIISCSCASAYHFTVSTQYAAKINLLYMHSSEPGSPACDCGGCTIFSLCNGECTNPSKKRRVHALPSDTSLACNDVEHRCRQPRTRQIIDAVSAVLKGEFCHKLLDGADHHNLILRVRAYFPGFKRSEGDASLEAAVVIDRLYQYTTGRTLWISDQHLERLRKLARSVGVTEAVNAVDKIEDLVMELTSVECVVRSGEMISYPSYCQYTSLEHVVYIVDGGFDLLPLSIFDELYCRVWKNVCKAIGPQLFLSFASCSTALHRGLI